MNNFANPYNMYQPRVNTGIIWVQGVEGAKAYQLMPNSNAMLLDSENEGRFYIKTSDNVGMCTLRTFAYEEVNSTPTDFITRSEFNKMIEELRGAINEQSISATKQIKPANEERHSKHAETV